MPAHARVCAPPASRRLGRERSRARVQDHRSRSRGHCLRALTTNSAPDVQRVQHELRRRNFAVTRIERVAPQLQRIVLGGGALAGFRSPGFDDHIKLFFVGDGDPVMHDFTPRRHDTLRGELWIHFYLHDADRVDLLLDRRRIECRTRRAPPSPRCMRRRPTLDQGRWLLASQCYGAPRTDRRRPGSGLMPRPRRPLPGASRTRLAPSTRCAHYMDHDTSRLSAQVILSRCT